MDALTQDLTRFFSALPFDVARAREIADYRVSPRQRASLRARLDRFAKNGYGNAKIEAKKLLQQLDAL